MNGNQHQSAPTLILWSFLIVAGMILIAPIPFFEFVLPKLLIFSLAAFVGTVAVLLRASSEDIAPLLGTWHGKFLLLFILTVFLSITWSVAPVLSIVGASPRFEGILSYSVFFALGLTAMVLSQKQRGMKALLITILISNVLVVFYGFLQLLGLDPLQVFWHSELFLGRLFSTIGQPNFLGQFILLTAPFTFLAIIKEREWRRLFWTFVAVLNIFVLLGTASRASLLGLLVAGMFLLLVLGRGHKKLIAQWRGNRYIWGSILLVLAGAVAFMSLSDRFSVATQERLSLGARGVMWETSLEMFLERPIGYGLETMGTISPRFMSAEFYEFESLATQMDRAHSKPIDLLITLGPVGLLTYYIFLVLLLLALWKQRKDALIMACFLGLIGESVAVSVGFDTAVTHVFFWMIAGMGLGLVPAANIKNSPRLQRFLIWLLALLVLLSIVLFSKWMQARASLVASEKFFARGEYSVAIQEGVRSIQRFPFDRSSQVRTAEKALLVLEQTDDPQSKELLNDVVDLGLVRLWQASKGNDGMISLLSAWQAALRGEDENVQEHVSRALELNPVNITTYRIAAHAFELLGNDFKKDAMLQELTEILPEWWDDPQSEKGRILRKENPWIDELIVKSE